MAANLQPRPNGRVPLHQRTSSAVSIQSVLEEDSRGMAESPEISARAASSNNVEDSYLTPAALDDRGSYNRSDYDSAYGPSTPGSRTGSLSDYDESVPPLDRLTVFDFLENLALSQRIEKFQNTFQLQASKARRSGAKLKSVGTTSREKVVEEWRRRVPSADEQLDKYKKRMKTAVDRLGRRWKDQRTVTMWEKAAFIAGVLNIFISGYLIGAFPQYFHWWYTTQLFYFMPIRYYTYKKRGYHYFLADLCYFVNLLVVLSVWVFPGSKRLFIGAYCLAYGNNAIAIAMWRNSLVFHSLDKVTSLFIHIMPCVTLHCLVHLLPPEWQLERFPAIHAIRFTNAASPEHYTLLRMMLWASMPYAFWQLSYHFFITVRRADKIAAGRPTSFTWLRKSYAPTWIGKAVLSLPNALQEPAFMGIQYIYALGTMVPCPLWFFYRPASGLFLFAVFLWSIYNGATYYIDVFGMRFQKELEQLKKDVAKWQGTPELGPNGMVSPLFTPFNMDGNVNPMDAALNGNGGGSVDGNVKSELAGAVEADKGALSSEGQMETMKSVAGGSGVQTDAGEGSVRERK